jgi:hypothetical protein
MDCDREADFRGEIISYGLWEPDSGAVAVSCTFRATEIYNRDTQQWEPWQYDMDAEGDIWIIGGKEKGNKLNEKSVQRLMEATGWNGDLGCIADRTWNPNPCSWSTEADEYKGQTRYKVAWVNAFDRTPGGGGRACNVDSAKAKALASKYGSQLRALAGSASKPAAPTTPPPRPAPQGVPAAQTRAANKVDDSEIPF